MQETRFDRDRKAWVIGSDYSPYFRVTLFLNPQEPRHAFAYMVEAVLHREHGSDWNHLDPNLDEADLFLGEPQAGLLSPEMGFVLDRVDAECLSDFLIEPFQAEQREEGA